MNGSTSEPQPILFGVPQGSLIGPLLFIIYINDLPSVVSHCKIQLYADDTFLYVSSSSVTDIELMLSEDLKHIIEWLNNNFLYLNYSKTKIMVSGTHQRLARIDTFLVKAKDTVLSRVYHFKYLGVILDPSLSWNDHVDYIGRKVSMRLGNLRRARDYLKCMLVFKCLNNLAPPYLLNEFSHSRDFHSYNTRHRDLLRPPLAKTTKYQGSFRFSGTKIWNSLPLDLRRTHDLIKLKSGLKKHLRSSYLNLILLSLVFFNFNLVLVYSLTLD